MRDYVWLLLVALASVQAQYYYPQPSPPFGLPEEVSPATALPTQAPTLAPTTQPPPPPPSVAPVVEEYTTPSPPPPTTAAPTAAPTTAAPTAAPTTAAPTAAPTTAAPTAAPTTAAPTAAPTTAAPTAAPTTLPPPPPSSTAAPTTAYAPPPPPPTTTVPPPAIEYLPPITTVAPPSPTTTLPPPPPPTTTLPSPPPPTTTLPPTPPPTTTLPPTPPPTTTLPPTTTSAPPPPTTTLPPRTTTLPPPPPSTTTYAPPPLEYLPPVTARPVVVPTENPLFPDANENQQVSVLFPTAAPTTTTTTAAPVSEATTPAPVVDVTPARPAPPPVQPVLTESEEEIAFWDFRESIPGEPELDYPIFHQIPVTSFTCDDKIDGYYADVEARCQVFHVCTGVPDDESIKNSFLCPNGTIFNQENFACQWWPDVECASSSDFFSLNENIGKVPEPSINEEEQVAIAAVAPVSDVAPAAEPSRTVEQATVVVSLPEIIQPAVQAQASAFSQSVAEPVFATAAAAVVNSAQLDAVAIPLPAVEIANEPAAAAAPEVQAVVIPEIVAPVDIPAPEVISIRDEPVQEVIQSALPQAPSGLYETPDSSSSGAQYKY